MKFMRAACLTVLTFAAGAVVPGSAFSTASDPNNPGDPVAITETIVNDQGSPMNTVTLVMSGDANAGASSWPSTTHKSTNPTTLTWTFTPPLPAGTEVTITWTSTQGENAGPTDKWWGCLGLPCHIYDVKDVFPARYDPSWIAAFATMALPDSTSPFVWVGSVLVDYYTIAPPATAIADTTLPPGVIRHVILTGSTRVDRGGFVEFRDPNPPVGNYRSVWRYVVDGVPAVNSIHRDRKAVLNPPPFSAPAVQPWAVAALAALLLAAGAITLHRTRRLV